MGSEDAETQDNDHESSPERQSDESSSREVVRESAGKAPSSPKPVPTTGSTAEGEVLDPSQRKLIFELETRMINIVRREARDPYGGLPADDVLARLDDRFPEQNFPERMLARLEHEQSERHAREQRQDELEKYVAETDRDNAAEERALVKSYGSRAERVLYFLIIIALVLVFTGNVGVASIIVGTTLVGVVGAFLAQQMRRKS